MVNTLNISLVSPTVAFLSTIKLTELEKRLLEVETRFTRNKQAD